MTLRLLHTMWQRVAVMMLCLIAACSGTPGHKDATPTKLPTAPATPSKAAAPASSPAPAATPTALSLTDVIGHLNQPRGVAITPNGSILVCDFGHSWIQQYTKDLKPESAWGGLGDAPGQFHQPCGVAVAANGEIFVADTWNARIQVFSAAGKFARQWSAAFYGPRGIAVDAKGSVFLSDTGNNRVMRFSAEGKKEAEWGGKGPEPGHFLEPVGLAVDKSGNVYVADNGNGRLQIFTRDGKFTSAFKVPGWEIKVYSEPAVTLDPRGTLWVTVPGVNEIRHYETSGKLLRTITSTSLPEVMFTTPMGIAYSAASRELIVSDIAGRLVRIPYAER